MTYFCHSDEERRFMYDCHLLSSHQFPFDQGVQTVISPSSVVYVPELIRAIQRYFASIETRSVVMTSLEFKGQLKANGEDSLQQPFLTFEIHKRSLTTFTTYSTRRTKSKYLPCTCTICNSFLLFAFFLSCLKWSKR